MLSQRVTVSDEAVLIERATAGDEQAFATLLGDCRGRAWAVCVRICGNRADAEDALQDATIAAWRNLDRFRSGCRFATWFYRIAANASLQVVRRRRDLPSEHLPERATIGSFADRVDDADLVQQALAQLRPEFRAAVVLREYGALTYKEIAEWQGIPVQTVKSRLNRGRAALAAQLAGELVDGTL